MKHKTILALTLCILLTAFALGCTNLVRFTTPSDSGEEAPSSDRLVGVLITDEYLDLFDTEGYISDHFRELDSGKEIAEAESSRYQGRLYAVLHNRGTSSVTDTSGKEPSVVASAMKIYLYFADDLTVDS